MAYADIDLNLTDEQKSMRDMVRRFGREVMRPAGIELDKLGDPADVIAEGSVLWDVFKQYSELGLHKAGLTEAFGGMGEEVDPMSNYLIMEESGYADAGLAISLGVCHLPTVRWRQYPRFRTWHTSLRKTPIAT
jgi:alkylation response protein AidB-like acyl-CoA dehydrogenase